ncbi:MULTISPECIES: aspartate/glutamate racemase family protein [Cupriavidus]|jgi:allantoin racemase|uniref:Hydantoin racemase n=2 Tax=Cupriavidus TaxID=106589 RepID=A0A375GDI4_9BURK|nr:MULTISPECIES: aspartate/glutamate racemase family protein [Cupriavidus]MBF6990411.1 aspartate/glutamate racemase family protein [Cupriavidus sp. IK-TO18]MBP0619939.1 aspartate/glutamate racemase family protein [Cupriavidus sp. LEh25]MBP0629322.1 aspartate/glutamate racemase family protein [Cupriavidus sp. AcVe19-1a]MBP0636433.1 aspartate/glutamate racemase family protein [Cupriavidus sp. AcVe19-6a]MDK2656594.1 aspartate/glutamate racemase family protein [Cupriavidus sp. LEh21]
MKLKIINPNTTESMTEKIGQCARAVAEQGTRISAVSPRMGPASIESHYDEALSVPGILDEILAGEQEGVDGYVIACFGDPGLYAAREVARGPVIGIAEAAMHMASMVGSSFSVVTTLARTCNIAWHLAERYGMKRFCSNVRACDLPVLDLERPGSDARRIITEACRRALVEDRSECIVLGCAGMTDLCDEIADAIGAPVIDGVTCAVKLAEAMVSVRLATSKRGDWARPLPKAYAGMLAPYALN